MADRLARLAAFRRRPALVVVLVAVLARLVLAAVVVRARRRLVGVRVGRSARPLRLAATRRGRGLLVAVPVAALLLLLLLVHRAAARAAALDPLASLLLRREALALRLGREARL